MELNTNNRIKQAIEKGVYYLKQNQQTDGSFLCKVTEKRDDYRNVPTCKAIVPSNIVLSSLCQVYETRTVSQVKRLVADFLLSERSDYWSYNYWFRDSLEYKELPYPDDVDDTFCALAALYEYDSTLFSGEALAKITTMLMSAEIKEGGPYNMWLVPKEAQATWCDIDFVVNSNVGYFLSLQGIELPALNQFIESKIKKEEYSFPYCDAYPGIYFAARFYKGEYVAVMKEYLVSHQYKDGTWGNPLMTALAVAALIRLSGGLCCDQIEKAVSYLLACQTESGGWEAYSFFFQMRTKQKTVYAGSEIITTALVVEALSLYLRQCKKEIDPVKNESQKYLALVERDVMAVFGDSNSIVYTTAQSYVTSFRESGLFEAIGLTHFYLRQSLRRGVTEITEEYTRACDVATVHGWIAYQIYDDFWDGSGDKKLLSVAHVALRASRQGFGGVAEGNPALHKLIDDLFLKVDTAHLREHQQGQKLNLLYEKSCAHSIGTYLILTKLGYTSDDSEWQSITYFFSNYLIARQLNDDIHDWEEDLHAGIDTPVVSSLKQKTKVRDVSTGGLQKLFWDEVAPDVLKKIELYCLRSQAAVNNLQHVSDGVFFNRLLAPIIQSVHSARSERQVTLDFIETYKKHIH